MERVGVDFFTKLKYPCRLRAAADGRLLFTLKRASLDKNRYDSALWVYEGGRARRLKLPAGTGGGWWLADGRLLVCAPPTPKQKALARKGLPTAVLQAVDVASGEVCRLAQLHHAVQDVAPLPDGRLVLQLAWQPNVEAALKKTGDDAEQAADALAAQAGVRTLEELPFWSNGEGYTAGGRSRLYLLDGKSLLPLTDEKTDAEGMRLSPTGRYLYYIAQRYEKRATIFNRLLRLDLMNGKSEDVSFGQPFRHYLCLPVEDDLLLVCATDTKAGGLNQNPAFYRLELPAKKATPLCDDGRYNLGNMVGSDVSLPVGSRPQAQGHRVWFVSTLGESSHLMTVDVDTGELCQKTQLPGAVQELALCSDEVVMLALRGQAPPELYRLEKDGKETEITKYNHGVRDKYELAGLMPLTVQGKENEVRGWVMRPPGLGKGQRCPVILNIHGGPRAAYGGVLFHEMQYWAARGFGVMFCNPTGSEGRGDAFADIRGRYGGVDYEDLMAFCDGALKEHSWMDRDRLGVAGGSYGGFMVNWIIGHTGRFKAAVSQRGIANWASMALLSDIGYYFVPDQLAADLWENPETAWRQSPLAWAKQVKTPTLFIHSEEDYRCPLPEGVQMYTALALNGVDAKLVQFLGENHELSRSGRPKNRVRRLEEMTAWFEKYL